MSAETFTNFSKYPNVDTQLRFYLPLEWLSIPWMRALHGTVNVFGFGLAGVAAWLAARPERSALSGA